MTDAGAMNERLAFKASKQDVETKEKVEKLKINAGRKRGVKLDWKWEGTRLDRYTAEQSPAIGQEQ